MIPANHPDSWRERLPWPDEGSHKHARGRLGVVSGGPLDTGAARLAARAGLRVGAGVVRLLCPPEAGPIIAAAVEAIMVAEFASPEDLGARVEAMDCVVIGPAAGLTVATERNLAAICGSGVAPIVDADALTQFKGRADILFNLLPDAAVLTPHEGEFERLFPGLLARGREEAARIAAATARCHVVLKGSRTLIAAPDGRMRVNVNGVPWLATAGSGDVLAGLVGGLRAQGMDPFEAACAAVWIHAEAAGGFGPGLIAEDLPDLIPAVLRQLRR